MQTASFVSKHIKVIECYPKPSATDPFMQPKSVWLWVTTSYSFLKGTGLLNSVAAPCDFTEVFLGARLVSAQDCIVLWRYIRPLRSTFLSSLL